MTKLKTGKLVKEHLRMWPQRIFDRVDIIGKGKEKRLNELRKAGVYILYRDDEPYYVGQAKNMRGRIGSHATDPTSRLFHFWNYFSAFVIEDSGMRSEVESILITAMPTTNNANPKLPKIRTPNEVRDLLREMRRTPSKS